MHRKDLLDIHSLSTEEIIALLDQAAAFKSIFNRWVKKGPVLKGKG